MVRNKAASYAVLAMVEIAEKRKAAGGPELQASDIANRFGLPMAYTAKVLSQLARASLLRSDRGPRGGFQLGREPEQITLYEIFHAVGAWANGDLRLNSSAPQKLREGVDSAVRRAMGEAKSVLESVKLSDLIEHRENAKLTA